jgi:hypothetical protein
VITADSVSWILCSTPIGSRSMMKILLVERIAIMLVLMSELSLPVDVLGVVNVVLVCVELIPVVAVVVIDVVGLVAGVTSVPAVPHEVAGVVPPVVGEEVGVTFVVSICGFDPMGVDLGQPKIPN